MFNKHNCMTQWLIGIFVRFSSSKDDLINCAGVEKRTLLNQLEFFPTPTFFSIIKFSIKIRETKGDQMERKQWMQMVFVASSMILLTGCYQRYQRQSSPKKEPVTSQTAAKKQGKPLSFILQQPMVERCI